MLTARKLCPDDAAAMRELRLESLEYYGQMFTSFLEQEKAKPITYWQDQCTEQLQPPYRCWFGAFYDKKLIGLQGTRLWEESPNIPVAFWWGTYAKEDYRCRGMMKQAYEARMQWAIEHHCQQIVAYVLEDKKRSLEILLKLGAQHMFTRQMRHGEGPAMPWHWYKIPLINQKLDAA